MANTVMAPGSHSPTMLDWAKRLDPDGKIAAIAELMTKQNDVLKDAVWMEGNLPTGHRTTHRTGIPHATWRRLNSGVAAGKSQTAQFTDTIGMLEIYSEVDKGTTFHIYLPKRVQQTEESHEQENSAYHRR